MAVERLAIVGTGLIGASVGLARAGPRRPRSRGWDPDPAALDAAVARGAVEPAGSLDAAVEGAELVLVAAPIAALADEVAAVLAATGEETTVTDVGSTKATVVEAAARSSRFVGGHPIVRLGVARRRERLGGPVRGRDLVPDADRRDRRRRGTGSSTASSPSSAPSRSRSTRRRTTGSSR